MRSNFVKDIINKNQTLKDLKEIFESFYIENLPEYGNSFFFQTGIFMVVALIILIITGVIMVIFGPFWWNFTWWGVLISQIHFWAAEIFMTLMIIHGITMYFTGAHLRRKDMWVLGVVIFFVASIQYAFGLGLNYNIVAQYNDKSGAGLWNSFYLYFINPENYGALYGWHIAVVPIILTLLIGIHILLETKRGISNIDKKYVKYNIVKADHKKLFIRAGLIGGLIIALGVILGPLWYYPQIEQLNIQYAAKNYPNLLAVTLIQEYNYTSGTATYSKFSPLGYYNPYNLSTNPYEINTRYVYVEYPYNILVNSLNETNYLSIFQSENYTLQEEQINSAYTYFEDNGNIYSALNSNNYFEKVIASLVLMGRTGLYDDILLSESPYNSPLDYTYTDRLLADMSLIHNIEGSEYKLHEYYFGMIKFNVEEYQIGSYWLFYLDAIEIIGDHIPWWHTLYTGIAGLGFFILLALLPWIPFLNTLPYRLKLYKIFFNKYTIKSLKR
ncbi:cytochrome b6 [Nanobdella aerobiophila]|uniref:Cytochrome b6 n=1 Tax=Nanobdella aerobiophila TaxID=2586965 RepID=A0A915WRN0_9ARCH|nr:cytochrome b N-terminal domain-containing protein [Nanobdella aerobiophila]BBL45873.1 cytochrome b6 [Nanobdella aerobiophila]